MEDILEEIVGEILDEYDEDEDAEIVKINDNTLMVSGVVPLKDILDYFPCEVEDYEDNDQIAWIILDLLNRYPKKGEKIKLTKKILCVVEKLNPDKSVIEKVKIIQK